MKKILALIIAIPALALFGGSGVLAWRIGETWSAATTQGLVSGLTVVCGSGALVLALLLALIVGIPLAIRLFGEAGVSHRAWGGGRQLSSPVDDVRLSPRRSLPTHAGFDTVEGQWRQLPTPMQPLMPSTPPWGMTGGGNPQLLSPPPAQDSRFGMNRDTGD